METVHGRVISVKPKTNRSGTDYEGVTIKGDDGQAYWFGNYKAPIPRGVTVVVTAESTSPGTGTMLFLNKIKEVAIIAADDPATAAAPRESTPGLPIEDDEVASTPEPDREVRVTAPLTLHNAAPKVMEDSSPSGTIDDLVEGRDPARYGGAIVFRSGMSKAEVEGVLRAISRAVASVDIREFNPKIGGPVFYIP